MSTTQNQCSRFSSIAIVVIAMAMAFSGCQSPSPASTTTQDKSAVPEKPATASAPAAVPAAAAAAAAAPALPILPHGEAVQTAVNTLFTKANLGDTGQGAAARRTVVIDPLIDGVTRSQTEATRAMGVKIGDLVRAKHPGFEVKPLTASELARSPLLIVGTFTPINLQGKTEGAREAYRFCLALVDLKSGKVVSKTVARSRMEDVDHTPLPYFRDAPGWTRDAATESYVKTCQASKSGDVANPAYIETLVAVALVEEGVRNYNAGRYKDARVFFEQARQTAAGNQLRVLNGLYLSNWKLGQRNEMANAFGQLVDYAFEQGLLAVTFLFKQGSSVLPPDGKQGPYSTWLRVISQRANQRNACLEVAGHTSGGGSELVNQRLSSLRAEHVRELLVSESPELARRVIATGYGSREMLVGLGRDDAVDTLDRRVEFKLLNCKA